MSDKTKITKEFLQSIEPYLKKDSRATDTFRLSSEISDVESFPMLEELYQQMIQKEVTVQAQAVFRQLFYTCLRLYKQDSTVWYKKFWETLYEWWQICTTPQGSYFFTYYNLSRELEIQRIIYIFNDNGQPQPGQFRPLLQAVEGQRFLRQAIKTWFLPRYDLHNAACCARFLRQHQTKETGITQPKEKIPVVWLALGGVSLGLLLLALFSVNPGTFFGEMPVYQFNANFWNWGCPLLPVLAAAALVALRWRFGEFWPHLLAPKLVVGILVGYLFIISDDFIPRALAKMDLVTGLAFTALNLAFAWFLIYFFIRKNLFLPTQVVFRRAWRLLLMGVIESIVMGIVIMDFFGTEIYTVTGLVLPPNVPFGVLGHPIHPKLLWYAFPSALLIGFLLQLFWEDRALAEV